MKALITIISSLLVGLALASANFSPIHELAFALGNKRRLLSAFAAAMTGYVLLITAFVISLVECVLQLDAQGFVMWSALLTSAVLLAGLGAAGLLFGKMLVPRVSESHSMFSELNRQFNLSETLERALHRLVDEKFTTGGEAPPRESERPPMDPLWRDRRDQSEPLFRDAHAADVLQH